MDRLKDKVAIVTGGNSGIGEATCELFAKEGAKVVVASLNASEKDDIAKKLKSMKADYMMIDTDISSAESVKKCFDKVMKKYKRVDVLVNNAGVLEKGMWAIDKCKEEDWNFVSSVNVKGTMLCMKQATQIMLKQKSGSIVNIASIAGAKGFAGAVYAATKGGMLGLARSSALRLQGTGVRINTICPGGVLTPMAMQQNTEETDMDTMTAMAKFGQVGKETMSLPNEIAYPILFLASDESSAITGQEIIVDKGTSL